MMDVPHVRQQMGSTAGVHHRAVNLLHNEYLAAENRILRAHLPTRLRLSDPERSTLTEIGKRRTLELPKAPGRFDLN